MLADINSKKDFIQHFFQKGVLIEPDALQDVDETKVQFNALAEYLKNKQDSIKQEDIQNFLKQDISQDISSSGVKTPSSSKYNVKIVFNYIDEKRKRTAADFVTYYNRRYQALSKLLRSRSELLNLTSISKVGQDNNKSFDQISVIGMITDISETKNKHFILEVEDNTGKIKVLLSNKKEELIKIGKDLVLDEVIGITGGYGKDIIFANKVVIPDIPLNKELKKSPDEAYAVFLSDLHIGSKEFMDEEFNKFLKWINGEMGNEKQKSIAKKIGYVIIAGDLIEGIGIHPNQEAVLKIKDIKKQYERCAELLSKIPPHIQIVLSPGNHDPPRLADPQPVLHREYAESLWKLPNVIMTTSPGIVNIHSSEKFPGFDVLVYHGNSLFYYVDKIQRLREAGGVDKIDVTLRYLLQKRHLAPAHGSTLFIPDTRSDPLVIEKIPDFLVVGHIHKAAASNYRSTTLISGSCWDGISDYALKHGSHPEPARAIIVNLQTRQLNIMKF
ncbi:metallophosphoesterase [Candidatus Woesearchaeota archaeon]|nr:metallophosphoesterase [Candidatus Woesearchaeota archaeon]MBW3013844.1 metallophosphoesterase [Candidatus Woesearchaeota archaeon]